MSQRLVRLRDGKGGKGRFDARNGCSFCVRHFEMGRRGMENGGRWWRMGYML